jgi:hypothetical protein
MKDLSRISHQWTQCERLQVIAALSESLQMACVKGIGLAAVKHRAEAIAFVAQMNADFLNSNRSTIESDL